MHVITVYICGDCDMEWDEEDDAQDCCTPAGEERARIKVLEAAGQMRFDEKATDAAIERFIKTCGPLFQK